MSFEPDEISLKPDKSLTRADVEDLLQQQGTSEQLNLSGLNLAVINFAAMDLQGAAFAYAHLNGANLLEANLERANLSAARLNGVKGHKVRLDEANLQGASLIEAKLDEASLRKAKLNQVNLSGADLRKANLSEADLSGANLSEADLSGADLSKACLYQSNLSRAILLETNLSEADLREAILGGAKLDGAKLDGANLSQVRLILVDFHEAKMSQANLSQADLSWSDLSGANLSNANLSEAKLIETDLTNADLRNASLTRANFSGANLSGARLVGAELHEVNLSGANLAGAYLSEQQKGFLEVLGDVLGLDETRSAQELSDLDAQTQPEETAQSPNGHVPVAELDGLEPPARAAVKATADLPPLASVTNPDSLQPEFAETELPALSTESKQQNQGQAGLTPAFDEENTASPTLSLVLKEQPLNVQSLARLLSALDELYFRFRLIEQGRFAELIKFHHSPDKRPNHNSSLTVRILLSKIELTVPQDLAAALLALNSLLVGIGKVRHRVYPAGQTIEINPALWLAESVVQTFWPRLDPNVWAMVAQTMLENIIQLADGPEFKLTGGKAAALPGNASPADWPSWIED